jgi:hypothetical protein
MPRGINALMPGRNICGPLLTPELRRPFYLLFVANQRRVGSNSTSTGTPGQFENWLPVVDASRTSVVAPPAELRRLLGMSGQWKEVGTAI